MITFLVSDTSSDFTTYIVPPLILDPNKRYEAALLSIDMYNSIPNVTEENNQLQYSLDDGATWKTIKLPIGSYELGNINEEIQRQMVEKGDYDKEKEQFYLNVTGNISTLKSIVEITKDKFKVNLGNLGSTLGFPPNQILKQGYHESPNIVDIMKINSILVKVDIICGSYVGKSQSPAIYSFYPNVPPGRKIVERPNPSLIYYPVNTRSIESIRLWLTDQDNKPVDIRGERVTVRIALREVLNINREIIEALQQYFHSR